MAAKKRIDLNQPLTFDELQAYWIAAGGPTAWAPTMAGIAMAESGGVPGAVQQGQPYSTTGWGLWQITPGNSVPQAGTNAELTNPLVNAKAAVAKFNAAQKAWGRPIQPWMGDPVAQRVPYGTRPLPLQSAISAVPANRWASPAQYKNSQLVGPPIKGESVSTWWGNLFGNLGFGMPGGAGNPVTIAGHRFAGGPSQSGIGTSLIPGWARILHSTTEIGMRLAEVILGFALGVFALRIFSQILLHANMYPEQSRGTLHPPSLRDVSTYSRSERKRREAS